jgi:HD-like signal output (HDOD) protein
MEMTLNQRLDEEAEQIIRELGIPPCPTVLTRLLKEMRQDEPDFAAIAKLISSDVGLAAAMLKTVNSPFFGLRTKATSVQQALSLLGLRNVVQIVTGALLKMAFPESGDDLDHFWERSAGIAQVAARLAKPLAGLDRDDVYTFALFRDCGIPLMMRKYPKYSGFLRDDLATAIRPFTQVEQALFKMDHARVGSALASSWMLPDETSAAILYHHDYPALESGQLKEASCKLVAIGLVSEFLYMQHVAAPNFYEWDKGGGFAADMFGIKEQALETYHREVEVALQPQ